VKGVNYGRLLSWKRAIKVGGGSSQTAGGEISEGQREIETSGGKPSVIQKIQGKVKWIRLLEKIRDVAAPSGKNANERSLLPKANGDLRPQRHHEAPGPHEANIRGEKRLFRKITFRKHEKNMVGKRGIVGGGEKA